MKQKSLIEEFSRFKVEVKSLYLKFSPRYGIGFKYYLFIDISYQSLFVIYGDTLKYIVLYNLTSFYEFLIFIIHF
jgi:hypothetical protein